MANKTSTSIDTGSVVHKDPVFQNDILTLAGADTIVPGTILARTVSTDKLVLYVIGGTANVNGTPAAILTKEVVVTGSGDSAIRPAIAGQFDFGRLVVDADGDNQNLDQDEKDKLRRTGLIAIVVNQLAQATP